MQTLPPPPQRTEGGTEAASAPRLWRSWDSRGWWSGVSAVAIRLLNRRVQHQQLRYDWRSQPSYGEGGDVKRLSHDATNLTNNTNNKYNSKQQQTTTTKVNKKSHTFKIGINNLSTSKLTWNIPVFIILWYCQRKAETIAISETKYVFAVLVCHCCIPYYHWVWTCRHQYCIGRQCFNITIQTPFPGWRRVCGCGAAETLASDGPTSQQPPTRPQQ